MNTGTTSVKSVSMHEKVFVTEAEAFLWPLRLILAHKRTPLIRKPKEISQLSQRSVIREKTCCSSKKQANGESKRKSITVLLLFSWSRKTNSISKTKNLKNDHYKPFIVVGCSRSVLHKSLSDFKMCSSLTLIPPFLDTAVNKFKCNWCISKVRWTFHFHLSI